MKKWRLIISGVMSPEENMGVDYALWQSTSSGESTPVIRFYQWNPPAVSVGYNQSTNDLINTEFCSTHNIPIVKRPTGGSAIFHDIELTYSFCGNVKNHYSFGMPLSSYITVCEGIIKGLEYLGIKAEIRGFSEGKEPSYTTRDCFSLSSRHDIVVEGRKIVGSAQRRNKNAFLQHGSILIDINRELWDAIFIEKVDFLKIISLKELFKKSISIEMLIKNIIMGFEDIFGVHFLEGALTEKERNRIGEWKSYQKAG
ncbi:MAG: lipoate--protein ligase family protein [bacterium]|nr:lipoate--protein ligase family protein [bacterium]